MPTAAPSIDRRRVSALMLPDYGLEDLAGVALEDEDDDLNDDTFGGGGLGEEWAQGNEAALAKLHEDFLTGDLKMDAQAAAAAKPSMRSPRVTRSSSSPSANGARRPPSVEAWARPHTLCIQAQLLVPRLRLHSFGTCSIHARPPGIQLQRNVGPPPSRSPSRRSQVAVRRGQRWRRPRSRGLSPRSMAVACKAQYPPLNLQMKVSRRASLSPSLPPSHPLSLPPSLPLSLHPVSPSSWTELSSFPPCPRPVVQPACTLQRSVHVCLPRSHATRRAVRHDGNAERSHWVQC